MKNRHRGSGCLDDTARYHLHICCFRCEVAFCKLNSSIQIEKTRKTTHPELVRAIDVTDVIHSEDGFCKLLSVRKSRPCGDDEAKPGYMPGKSYRKAWSRANGSIQAQYLPFASGEPRAPQPPRKGGLFLQTSVLDGMYIIKQ